MNEKVKLLAEQLPFGLEEFITGLSNKTRLAIVNLLLQKGTLRFSEIQKEVGLESNSLTQHLNVLLRNGIIARTKSRWDVEEEYFKSYYKLNKLYADLLASNIDYLRWKTGEVISQPFDVTLEASQSTTVNYVALVDPINENIKKPNAIVTTNLRNIRGMGEKGRKIMVTEE